VRYLNKQISDKPKPFRIYKPNKTNTGSAMQLDLNKYKGAVFLECAKQSGELSFDWGNKITVKLSMSDISKLLAVLNNKAANMKLFHQPSKGDYESSKGIKNNILELSKGQYGYLVRVSQQTDEGVNAIQISVGDDEAEAISILLKKAIETVYGW